MTHAKGITGEMIFGGDHVIIKKKGWPYGTKSEKNIPLRSIGATQWKEPGLTSGFLQVAYSGSSESKGGVFNAASDENTVMFVKKDGAAFRDIRDKIQAAISQPATAVAAPSNSVVDDLERLASLRDRGILTDLEFEAEKARVLGR